MAKKPEEIVRDHVLKMLHDREWTTAIMHGNMFQKGIPDCYAKSRVQPPVARWIDFKRQEKSLASLTKAQQNLWPVWHHSGIGIWILDGWTDEHYSRLFQPPNWMEWWRPRYGPIPDSYEAAVKRAETLVDKALTEIIQND